MENGKLIMWFIPFLIMIMGCEKPPEKETKPRLLVLLLSLLSQV